MQSYHAIAAYLLLLLIPAGVHAQSFLSPDRRPSPDSASFTGLVRGFDDWAGTRDLPKTRGWKWFKRWSAVEEQRLNPDGEPVGVDMYVAAVQSMEAARLSLGK